MAKDWKDRLGVVFSTNPDFNYENEEEDAEETLPPEKQKLKVSIDRKRRKGKTVTLVEEFVGSEDDLKELAKMLKTKCGVGGSAKDGEIVIQGDFKQKVAELLKSAGYKVRVVG
jgi:translation initiation factor 1